METNWKKITSVTKNLGGIETLAEKIKIPASTVRNWYNRKSIPIESIPSIVFGLENQITVDDVKPDYFKRVRDAMNKHDELNAPRNILLIKIENFNLKTNSVVDQEKNSATIPVDKYLAKKLKENAFAVKMKDTIMEPIIGRGDIIIVDPNCTPIPGDVVIAKLKKTSSYFVARYKIIGYEDNGNPKIILIPANTDFPSIDINSNSPGLIIGPVIEHRRILHKFID